MAAKLKWQQNFHAAKFSCNIVIFEPERESPPEKVYFWENNLISVDASRKQWNFLG